MSRAPRTFESLRASGPVVEAPALDGIENALRSIAITPDGQHMVAWVQWEMRRPSHPAASADTLREAEGARRAYERLLDMMEANQPVR